ncbi:hypothetical protein BDF19DRAFT_451487 [Syncephalis fuscata]|nr:hypothetical protein BDF19DRAFT_451487 [Syncephalis fuscata]
MPTTMPSMPPPAPVGNQVPITTQSHMTAVPMVSQPPIIYPTIVPQTMAQPVVPVNSSGYNAGVQYGPVPPNKPTAIPQQAYGIHKPMVNGVNLAMNNHTNQLSCMDGMPHSWVQEYTMAGILWAVCLFPCGVICCQNSAYKQCIRCKQIMK